MKKSFNYQLILCNDDSNSFEDVIMGLTQILGHSTYQAEQCAHIVHYKGQYAIKHGSKKELLEACDALSTFGLMVKIQKNR